METSSPNFELPDQLIACSFSPTQLIFTIDFHKFASEAEFIVSTFNGNSILLESERKANIQLLRSSIKNPALREIPLHSHLYVEACNSGFQPLVSLIHRTFIPCQCLTDKLEKFYLENS